VSAISRRPAKPDQPTRLSEALDNYLRTAGLKKRLQQAAILEEWMTLVGPQIAAVTAPQFITADGVMRVHVATAPWATELGLMTPRILARLNQGRSGRVKEIRWVPGPLDRPQP
jgi:predicted nucleic acid-binding Zn ribbon protein